MSKFAPFALLAIVSACGAASREAECEIADCDETLVEACKTAVGICEDAGDAAGTLDLCVDGVIAGYEISCDATVDTDAE